MKYHNWVNIVLFIAVAIMLIISGNGGFANLNETWIEILVKLGVSMLGGVICGLLLFGIIPIKNKTQKINEHFAKVDLNRNMGQQFWIDFIKNIDSNQSTLWFVGKRHLSWIDRRYAYRSHIIDRFQKRVNKYKAKSSPLGEIIILVSDLNAFKEWKKLVLEIVENSSYSVLRPNLIQIGLVDENYIKYSIVAFEKGVVITPYTSSGRSDNSPTFDVNPDSEVAKLYLKDLEFIRQQVKEENWWQAESKR